jgi:hydroxyethylthiazole kinase-like uncharacterized protein yjeF
MKIENERKPVSAEEMRQIEERGSSSGISKLVMMENAGSAIANYVLSVREVDRRIRVLAIAGTGNNGGDVFVAARHLAYYRNYFDIKMVLIGEVGNIRTQESIANWGIISSIPSIEKIAVSDSSSVKALLKPLIYSSNIIICGIFGTGFHGTPRDLQLSAIQEINRRDRSKSICISADIPSGMEADTGASDYAIISDTTITMHAPKIGMFASEQASNCCGKIVIANIGLAF